MFPPDPRHSGQRSEQIRNTSDESLLRWAGITALWAVVFALHRVQAEEGTQLSEPMVLTVVAITLLGAAIVGDLLDGAGHGECSDQQRPGHDGMTADPGLPPACCYSRLGILRLPIVIKA